MYVSRRGKPTKDLIPQKELMMQFVEGLHTRHPSWNRDYTDWCGVTHEISVCTWKGLSCNSHEHVTFIKWVPLVFPLQGNLSWEYLPNQLTAAGVSSHPLLRGTLSLDSPPTSLCDLRVQHNAVEGELNLANLPYGIKRLVLSRNRFQGGVDLTQLPETLEELDLHGNLLSGLFEWGNRLPPSLRQLCLQHNQFYGRVDFAHFPEGLTHLLLFCNDLEGNVALEGLPQSLSVLLIQGNRFCGIVDLNPVLDLPALKNGHFVSVDVGQNRFSGYVPNGRLPTSVRYEVQLP